MADLLYIDLLINDGNFSLNTGNEPITCNNQQSIGQDIVHAIIESGLIVELIAERGPILRADIFTQLELLVESDERIIPGTVVIEEESAKRLFVTAQTYEFGTISAGVTL